MSSASKNSKIIKEILGVLVAVLYFALMVWIRIDNPNLPEFSPTDEVYYMFTDTGERRVIAFDSESGFMFFMRYTKDDIFYNGVGYVYRFRGVQYKKILGPINRTNAVGLNPFRSFAIYDSKKETRAEISATLLFEFFYYASSETPKDIDSCEIRITSDELKFLGDTYYPLSQSTNAGINNEVYEFAALVYGF